MSELCIVATGPLSTVQDLGRHGLAEIGVGASGAADQGSFRLANRLLGNPESAAAIEVTLGGLVVRAPCPLTIAITGAPCPIMVGNRSEALNTVLRLPAEVPLRLGQPDHGLRSYLGVRGGIDLPPVLGSRSTDLLAGIGPAALRAGDTVPVGPAPSRFPVLDTAPVDGPAAGDRTLRVRLGPRHDWFTEEAINCLLTARYEATSESNRVGMRLAGPPLHRAEPAELPSEGAVTGALQVPPAGLPTLFLADHPITGGYPVIAVVRAADLDAAAQIRPGTGLRFRLDTIH
ncbi:biotin-dependent carboxylase-like uncharacterized protein [Tamaricihabitans halophyticus]|uniref:Biotin-dependent carboxylase-like uncharacterized protein n=1 Tax=Tamaricihabitans halophyticus TaxID=1262583 RepID=A0A4R2QUV1_9PSEU|nr:biotin-dependent carboxyltransferase family protein [Tamaricihabitans halophyticus]TCP53497.1 biotin-dependent carboxylase-like uncharacterized protein [Tamaricihabitans halophyticus]